MKPNDLTIEAGARFISSEMQDIFDRVVFLIPNWKWMALVGAGFAVYFLNFSLRGILKKLKTNQTYFKEKTFIHFLLKLEIEKSVSWAVTILMGLMFVESLQLPINFEKYLLIFLKVVLAYNLVHIAYSAAEAFGELITTWTKQSKPGIDEQLVYMASKTLKVFVIIIGCLIVLQNFGVNVTALLAGLGLGGVALAFAAQDTVANVFGTITILLDTPFRIGDTVKIGDTEGVIEEIGFRSTRIRTLYNSLIIMPNSVVAKEKIDNLSRRQSWIRFRNILNLNFETTQDQIRLFCQSLQTILLQDQNIDRQRISITFNGFAESSLTILINFHYHLGDTETEADCNQNYLALVHDLIQKLKLNLSFPTRTLILKNNEVLNTELSQKL